MPSCDEYVLLRQKVNLFSSFHENFRHEDASRPRKRHPNRSGGLQRERRRKPKAQFVPEHG